MWGRGRNRAWRELSGRDPLDALPRCPAAPPITGGHCFSLQTQSALDLAAERAEAEKREARAVGRSLRPEAASPLSSASLPARPSPLFTGGRERAQGGIREVGRRGGGEQGVPTPPCLFSLSLF